MTRTGRPPKPTALKIIEGNPGHRPLPENEPTPAVAGLEAPAWVKAAGRRVWDELAPEVHANGCLTKMDTEAFALLCSLEAVVRRSPAKHLKEAAQVDRLMARFGMTPSDRTRISVKKQNDDPFAEFLGKRATR